MWKMETLNVEDNDEESLVKRWDSRPSSHIITFQKYYCDSGESESIVGGMVVVRINDRNHALNGLLLSNHFPLPHL